MTSPITHKPVCLPSIHSLSLELPVPHQAAAPTTNPASFAFSKPHHTLHVPTANYTAYPPPKVLLPSPSLLPNRMSVSPTPLKSRSRSSSDPVLYQSPTSVSSTQLPSIGTRTQSPEIKAEVPSTLELAVELQSHEEKSWKPRKKRQCPECKLYFSNLATHKSTHLKPTARPHICKYCDRGFARLNDLFRHVKCHWKEIGSDKGQFKCPFKDHASGDHCCHSSGIFSRCDTFKNHLKAIHFQYPNGTKKDQRNKVSGHCRMCQEQFHNVDDWMVNHIERNKCPYACEYKKA